MAFIKEINKIKNFWVDWLDTVHSWQFTFVVTLDLRYHWVFSCHGFLQLLFAQLQLNNNCINEINCACGILQHAIFCLLALNVMLNDTYGTRRLHPGLPINLHGQGFHCPAEKKSYLIILHYLHSAGGLRACKCGYTRITFAIVSMLGTPEDTIQSKTGAVNFQFLSLCVFVLCVIAPHGWIVWCWFSAF